MQTAMHHIKDDLAYCQICGQPRQQHIEWMGETKLITIPCRCDEEREQIKKEKEAIRAIQKTAQKNRKKCFQTAPFYASATFSNDDGKSPATTQLCYRYAETFEAHEPHGLLLWGGVGTGKSYASACIANEVIGHGYTALFTDITTLVHELENFDNKHKVLTTLAHVDLLCLEDFGVERGSEYMASQIYTIIDTRYKSGKPFIITTNLNLDTLTHAPSTHPLCRVYDRLLERCFPLEFCVQRRRQQAANMRTSMKKRLGITS